MVDPVDDTYRRQINRQLTVQESRHRLARDGCHGKRGTIHQAYRDRTEDQLGARHRRCPAEGRGPRDSGRGHRPAFPAQAPQPEPAGRYSFTASTPAADALRPLRAPDAPELDEDDDGSGQDQGWQTRAG
nr:Tn3 family transposase [Streptomyces sp. AC550_RSS872]